MASQDELMRPRCYRTESQRSKGPRVQQGSQLCHVWCATRASAISHWREGCQWHVIQPRARQQPCGTHLGHFAIQPRFSVPHFTNVAAFWCSNLLAERGSSMPAKPLRSGEKGVHHQTTSHDLHGSLSPQRSLCYTSFASAGRAERFRRGTRALTYHMCEAPAGERYQLCIERMHRGRGFAPGCRMRQGLARNPTTHNRAVWCWTCGTTCGLARRTYGVLQPHRLLSTRPSQGNSGNAHIGTIRHGYSWLVPFPHLPAWATHDSTRRPPSQSATADGNGTSGADPRRPTASSVFSPSNPPEAGSRRRDKRLVSFTQYGSKNALSFADSGRRHLTV